MNRISFVWLWAIILLFSLSSCEVIGGIFKAGIWVGIILVFVVVALIIWIASKFRK